MRRRLKQFAVVLVAAFAAAQLIRPDRTNHATDANRSIKAKVGSESGLAAVLDRAWRDGKMPGSFYITLRPEARLSAQDVDTICAAARDAEIDTGEGGAE